MAAGVLFALAGLVAIYKENNAVGIMNIGFGIMFALFGYAAASKEKHNKQQLTDKDSD